MEASCSIRNFQADDFYIIIKDTYIYIYKIKRDFKFKGGGIQLILFGWSALSILKCILFLSNHLHYYFVVVKM
jgi:hypothetical protein